MNFEKKNDSAASSSVSDRRLRNGNNVDGVWITAISKTTFPGQKYYFNTKTGERRWTRPCGVAVTENSNGVETSRSHLQSSDSAFSSRRKRPSDEALPTLETANKGVAFGLKRRRHPTGANVSALATPAIRSRSESRQKAVDVGNRGFQGNPSISNPSISSDSVTPMDISPSVMVDEDMPLAHSSSSAQHAEGENGVEAMEVDEIIEGVQSVRRDIDTRTTTSATPLVNAITNDWDASLTRKTRAKAVVVLDTNILLSDLKFVNDLEKRNESLQLVVPFVVLRELDFLKDNRGGRDSALSRNARTAIGWIRSQLTKGNNSNVIFQPSFADQRPISGYMVTCNDDRIIKCTLEVASKSPTGGPMVILCSDDKNMLNKGRVDGLRCASKGELKNYLRGLDEKASLPSSSSSSQRGDISSAFSLCALDKPTINHTAATTVESKTSPNEDAAGPDIEQIMDACRDLFCAFAEKEMKEGLGDLWIDVAKVKPPWTLAGVLDLMNQHWMAIFSWAFNSKSIKPDLEALRDDAKDAAVFGSKHFRRTSSLQRLIRVVNVIGRQWDAYQTGPIVRHIQRCLAFIPPSSGKK